MAKGAVQNQSQSKFPLIALLTDFGNEDWYVSTMKGVIKGICPQADIVDISHSVRPQSIVEGALMLNACHRYFPAETIFVVVIDPGVGTAREAVLVRANEQWFLAPNNGLLGFVMQRMSCDCRKLTNPDYHLTGVSNTFHGRDIFAPCAAHLAAGAMAEDLAPETAQLFGLPISEASSDRGSIEGNIIYFDHFGNAITNIPKELFDREPPGNLGTEADVVLPDPPVLPSGNNHIRGDFSVSVEGRVVAGIGKTYADVEPGQAIAYWGSMGNLEVGVNRGNAKEDLGLKLYDKIIIKRIIRDAH